MDAMERLILAVNASGMKRTWVARVAGLDDSKLSKILNRKQVPTVPEFVSIARAINIDPARLFSDGELVVELETLRAAHAASQRVTEILAAWLPDRAGPVAEVTAIRPQPKRREQPHAVAPVEAAANPNAELVGSREEKRTRIPRRAWNRGARIIARAVGDSMSGGPDPIVNRELVFLKPTRSPRTANNHTVLVRRGDALYLKKFEKSGSSVRLVSTNGEPPIVIDPGADDVQIYGFVVDHEHAP